jgi:hypothetical protein
MMPAACSSSLSIRASLSLWIHFESSVFSPRLPVGLTSAVSRLVPLLLLLTYASARLSEELLVSLIEVGLTEPEP